MDKLIVESNVFAKELNAILEIVKQFIIDNKLILYGGQAIDFMLRLKGNKLYDDNVIPDYDFYSTTHIEHSYKLIEILIKEGFDINELSVINAMHPQTIRVRYKFNVVADISYISENVFNTIMDNALNYNGIFINNPYMQYIDMHSSLYLPFRSFPKENIYNRWKKDITRYNLLFDYYQLPEEHLKDHNNSTLKLETIQVEFINDNSTYLYGMPLYALLYKKYKYFMKLNNKSINKDIISTSFHIKNNKIEYSSIKNILPSYLCTEYNYINDNLKDSKEIYKPMLDVIPTIIVKNNIEYNIILGWKFSISEITIGKDDDKSGSGEKSHDSIIKCGSIQMLLAYMMYMATFKNVLECYSFYNSLLLMIKDIQGLNRNDIFDSLDNPFALDVSVSNDNTKFDPTKLYLPYLGDDRAIIDKFNLNDLLPKSYYPGKEIKTKSDFQYNILFELDGLKTDNIDNIFRIKYHI